MACAALLAGPLLGGFLVLRAWDTCEDLADAPTTRVVGLTSSFKRQHPIIEVNGTEVVCVTEGRIFGAQVVRYDPEDPSRCRREDNIGQLTTNQKFDVAFGIGVLALCCGLGVYLLRAPTRA